MSAHRVVTTRRADDDIAFALAWYVEAGALDAASGLIDALQEIRDLLAAHSSIGSARYAAETGILDLRSLSTRGHPYVVLYLEAPEAIRIVRVLHASRDMPAELGGE